ncbi:hypothetical protein XELAEV_18009686mg [Xenopus laevis]|uniref:Uncharacterized protein n=1 Tax=Xenopus laevis TaxID=8355 RepID=A0A974DT69_XENLA|nr:hypothetical protein XELAEV_18009686mg [Xenopus laevis]
MEWKDFVNLQESGTSDIDCLLLFILEHVEAKHILSYIKKQLAGISFFIKMLAATDITKAPVIKQIYRGIARVNVTRQDRRQITMNILRKMLVALELICASLYEVKLFQGLFLVMYFAALELVRQYQNQNQSQQHLGLPVDKYKSHSFRIGAATQADLMGMDEKFIKSIGRMYANWEQPDIIVIHLGGNDIDTIITWSEVVSRRVWLYDIQHRPVDRCRRKLNFAVAKFLRSLNMSTYRHQELELGAEGLFRTDGVHLSDIGNYIFNTSLQKIIEKAIFKWRCATATFMM